jgi:hypothetical protein
MEISQQSKKIYLVAFLLSSGLFFLNQFYYPIVSLDAFLYLLTAKTFLAHGIKAAFAAYSWPFYSILIAYVSQLTGLSILHAALSLTYVFFVATVVVFIALLRQLRFGLKLQWLGLLVILSFHFFTAYSHDTIRDNGYYLFYLLSVLCLLVFLRRRTFSAAFLWSVFSAAAVLFRTEGGAFVLLIPFVVFFVKELNWRQRLINYLKLNSLFIVFAVVLLVVLFALHGDLLARFTTRLRIIEALLFGQHAAFSIAEKGLQSALPGPMQGQAGAMLWFALIGILPKIILEGFGFANLIPFVASFRRTVLSRIAQPGLLVLLAYLLVNLCVLAVFLMSQLLLVSRYCMAFELTALPLVVLGLAYLYQRWRQANKSLRSIWTWVFSLVVLLFAVNVVGTLIHIGPSKRFQLRASDWLNQHTAKSAVIYSNVPAFISYVSRTVQGPYCIILPQASMSAFSGLVTNCFNWTALQQRPWQSADYLALYVRRRQQHYLPALKRLLPQKPLVVFKQNRDRGAIYIFKLD